jgi:pimeloyl-ACP methyl ester carboxylesterase
LPDLTQSRSPCRSEPGGWCGFVREAAVESYAYAMLSSNAYQDKDEYLALPPGLVEREAADTDDSGLAFSVFDRFANGSSDARAKPAARIIAFRGTDFGSTSDLLSGTLGDGQRTAALAIYAAERAYLDNNSMQDVPIEVTGHSLGGALATQISIDNPGIKAFVFNTSPFFAGDPMQNDTDRLAVAERGEFLRVLRRYKAPPAANAVIINCSPTATAAGKHSIRKLADCLTWIAAYDDKAAFSALGPNAIAKPEVECGALDKVHPGPARGAAEPCVHLATQKVKQEP